MRFLFCELWKTVDIQSWEMASFTHCISEPFSSISLERRVLFEIQWCNKIVDQKKKKKLPTTTISSFDTQNRRFCECEEWNGVCSLVIFIFRFHAYLFFDIKKIHNNEREKKYINRKNSTHWHNLHTHTHRHRYKWIAYSQNPYQTNNFIHNNNNIYYIQMKIYNTHTKIVVF